MLNQPECRGHSRLKHHILSAHTFGNRQSSFISVHSIFCFVLFFFICKQITKEAERTAVHLGGAHPPQGVWGSLGHPRVHWVSMGGMGAPHWGAMFQKQWDCSSPRGHNRARTDPSLSLWPPARLGGSSQPTSHRVGRKRQRIFFQKRAGVTHHSQDIQQILSLK